MKNKFLKIIILFFALLLPVCIFLFLKMFGSNEFNIPTYYQTQAELDSLGCDGLVAPYQLESIPPTSVLSNQRIDFDGASTIVFAPSDSLLSKEQLRQLNRVLDRLPAEMARMLLLSSFEQNSVQGWELFTMEKLAFDRWKKCGLLSKNKNEFVLIDKNRNIRGYYASDDVEEVDRLIVEVKILNSRK